MSPRRVASVKWLHVWCMLECYPLGEGLFLGFVGSHLDHLPGSRLGDLWGMGQALKWYNLNPQLSLGLSWQSLVRRISVGTSPESSERGSWLAQNLRKAWFGLDSCSPLRVPQAESESIRRGHLLYMPQSSWLRWLEKNPPQASSRFLA